MKVLMINAVCGYGSTGRICTDIAKKLEEKGHVVKIAYGRNNSISNDSTKYAVKIGTNLEKYVHVAKTRIFDSHGLGSKMATKRFLLWLETFRPDVIWLHNIHGYFINYPLLFEWIKKHPDISVKWTLHDCWSYTGHCAHYSYIGCQLWKTGCHNCPQKKEYPKSVVFDRSHRNWTKKKKEFLGVKNLQIITPSIWLANEVKKSYLSFYDVKTIPNGIDLNVFHPTESNLREEWNLQGKKIILGVSSKWYQRKGEQVFIELAAKLNQEWQIVMIGVPSKRKEKLPKNILLLDQIKDREILAQWYTIADVFLNPSYEETMGLTSAEALACGTPVILFNRTALPEVVDKSCGVILESETTDAILDALSDCDFSPTACIERARQFSNEEFVQKCCEILEE